MIPLHVLESGGSLVIKGVLKVMVPRFVKVGREGGKEGGRKGGRKGRRVALWSSRVYSRSWCHALSR